MSYQAKMAYKTKRLLVELPTLFAASVEVEPEYIQLL